MTTEVQPWALDIEAVGKQVDAHLQDGLSAFEAASRLEKNGLNTLFSAPPIAVWRRVWAQFQDPLVYLLFVAIGIAVLAWALGGFVGWPIDAVVITVVVLLNGALGFLEEAKARDAVAALARMTQARSTVVRGGHKSSVNSEELVTGDLLVLSEGDAVGADARLVQCASLALLEAPLTGESHAIFKNTDTLAELAALGDRLNMVFKGTAVTQGSGMAVVTAKGMATEMGAIARLLKAVKEEPTPLEKEIRHIGRLLGVVVLAVTVVVVATVLAISDIRDLSDVVAVLLFGVALAVAAVPEGLPAILSVVLALGVRRMAGQNAIVKKLASVEALGSATVIATDKTGTLTRSEMTIETMVSASGQTQVTGVGYSPDGEVLQENLRLAPGLVFDEQQLLLTFGCLAGNASLAQSADSQWAAQGDPTEAAFLVAERKLVQAAPALRSKRYARQSEIPFTSERKMMSTVECDHAQGGQRVLVSKGAPDVLLQKCTRLQVGATTQALSAAQRGEILQVVSKLSGDALRTLAVAYRLLDRAEASPHDVATEHDLVYVGTVGMRDPPRPEVAPAIAQAHAAGIRVVIITGDHPATAARIASDLGIIQPGGAVLTGVQLDALNAPDFAQAAKTTSVYARVSPANKLRIVAALRADGQVVAMTGDGINDAPALKSADVGIAMGITGTEVTKEAADVILADDNFATIVDAVREGRSIFDNIRKFLRYLLSSNMGEVLTVFFGIVLASVIGLNSTANSTGASAFVLPLLATQILWLNLVTDSWPALAIGIDPPAADLMARKPRPVHTRVIDLRMWAGVVESGLVIAAVALMTIDMCLPGGLIEPGSVGMQPGDLIAARTAGFTVLVLAHLLQCFNARSETRSAFADLLTNRWIWAAVALSSVLQIAVVNVGFLNTAFGTVPLSASQWLLCMAMASLVLWYSELRKLALRRWNSHLASTPKAHQ